MNRRHFLTGAGGTLLAAPFLASVGSRGAQAQAAFPQRLVVFFTPNGCLTNRWFPSVENGSVDAAALNGCTLEPLAPFANKLLLPRGLRSLNAYGQTQAVDPYDQAMGSKLTCAPIAEDGEHYALSHSLDHEVARQVNPGSAPPLVLSVGASSSNVKELLSYSAPETPYPATVDPRTVYAQIAGGPAADQAAYQVARKRRLFDVVADDLSTYRSANMSQSDRARVEAWLALVESAEDGLAAACAAQVEGVNATAVNAAGEPATTADAFTTTADMMARLMALAMVCDSNRALVLSFSGFVTFDWDGIQHTVDHAALSRRRAGVAVGSECLVGAHDMIGQIDAWYARKFASLVALLDDIPEGEGTLLDNTATLWLPEFADGAAMNLNNLPIVIAGSAGGALRQGVSVNVAGGTLGTGNSEADCQPGETDAVFTGSSGGNVPINKLYVTLLNAVGCTSPDGAAVTSFGTFDGYDVADGITEPGGLAEIET